MTFYKNSFHLEMITFCRRSNCMNFQEPKTAVRFLQKNNKGLIKKIKLFKYLSVTLCNIYQYLKLKKK